MSEEKKNTDSKLLEGIAYFEQMLQAMPRDRTTLEFLAVAYPQAGEREKYRLTLIKLAEVLIDEGDLESAGHIADRLEQFEESDAKAIALKIRALRTPSPELVPEKQVEPAVSDVVMAIRAGVKAETALVDSLCARRVLDAKAGASVKAQLEGLPESERPFLVSAVAIIDRENSAAAQSAMAFMADGAGAPPVPVMAFEPSAELVKAVPENAVRVRGAIPFAKLGDTLLVALLNPLDDALRRDIEKSVGGPCRFYLTSPASAEAAVEKFFPSATAS